MDKKELSDFLLKARAKTYAGGGGKVKSALKDSVQLEYKEKDYLYRDVYYNGKNSFMGLEGIYYNEKLVWGMSYYGTYKGITEEEVDKILRKALIDNPNTRTWEKIEKKYKNYLYECIPGWESQSIDEIAGVEKITRDGEDIYFFYYAGSTL